MAAATPLPLLGAKSPRPDSGFLWDGIVNGPVQSRRLGTSLGLNLTPARSKLCTFDCPYCECGFNTPRADGSRWPSPDEVAHALRRGLARLAAPPEWITFAGNGEPTMHPRFPVVVDRVLAVRAELVPSTRVAVLSNGRAAGKPEKPARWNSTACARHSAAALRSIAISRPVTCWLLRISKAKSRPARACPRPRWQMFLVGACYAARPSGIF